MHISYFCLIVQDEFRQPSAVQAFRANRMLPLVGNASCMTNKNHEFNLIVLYIVLLRFLDVSWPGLNNIQCVAPIAATNFDTIGWIQ